MPLLLSYSSEAIPWPVCSNPIHHTLAADEDRTPMKSMIVYGKDLLWCIVCMCAQCVCVRILQQGQQKKAYYGWCIPESTTVMSNVEDIHSVLCVALKNLASALPSLLCCLMPRTKRKLLFTSYSFKSWKLQETQNQFFKKLSQSVIFLPASTLWLNADMD